MQRLRVPLILVALSGLIAVTGCGASEGTSTSPDSDALSKDDYAQRAQDVLIDFGSGFEELGARIAASKTTAEFKERVDSAEEQIKDAIDDFGSLRPPEDAQKGHDQVLSALENLSSKLADVGVAAGADRKGALRDAATALRTAAFEFQDQLIQAQQSFQDAGLELGDAGAEPTGSTDGD